MPSAHESNSVEETEAIAADLARTLRGGECVAVSSAASIQRFLDSPALSDATRKAYGRAVREFASWLQRRGVEVEAIDVPTFADYAAELGAARSGRVPRRMSSAMR